MPSKINEAIRHQSEIRTEVTRRIDNLRDINDQRIDADIRHIADSVALRAEHAKEIATLESSRLNAIRQVDVLAVESARAQAQTAINALAATTATNAETLRNALTSTAASIAAQLANTVAQITERIGALEKSSYEGKGKQAVSDPMITELVMEMKRLSALQSIGNGKSAGMSSTWGIMIGVISLAATLITIFTVLSK